MILLRKMCEFFNMLHCHSLLEITPKHSNLPAATHCTTGWFTEPLAQVLEANGIKDSHQVSRSLKNRLAEPCAWKIHEVHFRWSLLDSSSSVSACRAVAERLFWSATANGWQMALRCFTALATVSWHWAHSCQFVVDSVYPVQTHSTLSLSLSHSLSPLKGKATTSLLRCTLLGRLARKCD